MTWTYSGNPATSIRDQVRFWYQDTDPENEILQDEELDYLLWIWFPAVQSPLFVAAIACEVVAAKYADEVNVAADGVSVSVGDLQDKYMKLAEQLRDQWKDHAWIGNPIGIGGYPNYGWPLPGDDGLPDWGSGTWPPTGWPNGGGGSGGGGGGNGGNGGNGHLLWDDNYDPTIKPMRFGIGHMDNYEVGKQDYGGYDPGNDTRTWGYWNATFPHDAVITRVAIGGQTALESGKADQAAARLEKPAVVEGDHEHPGR